MRGGHAHVKRIDAVGQNGRPACRQCGADVVKGSGRRVFCSERCATEYSAQFFWEKMRTLVCERDGGLCQICGRDTAELCRQINARRYGPGAITRAELAEWIRANGGKTHTHDQFDVDHIVPIAEGGTNAAENLRTLCYPCHKAETRKLRERLKAKRKGEAA